MTRSKQFVGLMAWLGITFVAAAIGAAASIDAATFYAGLTQPRWAPPGAWFGPVWTVLYVLMAVSAWLVWRARGWPAARGALTMYLLQLALNALWSVLFFHWHEGALAFIDIVALWLLIIATLSAFWRAKPMAGALLVPYLVWVSFAMALNLAVWQFNPQIL